MEPLMWLILGMVIGAVIGIIGVLLWFGHELSFIDAPRVDRPKGKPKKENEEAVIIVPQLEWKIPEHWQTSSEATHHWATKYNGQEVHVSLPVWPGNTTHVYVGTALLAEAEKKNPVVLALIEQAKEMKKKENDRILQEMEADRVKRSTASKQALDALLAGPPENPVVETKQT